MADETKVNTTSAPGSAGTSAEKPAAVPETAQAAPAPGTQKDSAPPQLKVLSPAASAAAAAPAPGAKPIPAESIAPAKPAAAPAPPKEKHEKEKAKPLKPEKPTEPGAIVVEESVEIAAPLDMVWRFFLNFVKWPEWNPVCLGVKSLVQGTSFGLGWRFELRLKCGPLKLTLRPTILENTTPQVIRWLGGWLGVHGMHWFIFEKTETGTRVTSYEEFTGPLRWLMIPMRGWTKQMFRIWLGALKEQVEKKMAAEKKSPPLKPPE